MSERFKIKKNKNNSKNTRLPVGEDFSKYRFNRDELAHVSRYLFICEELIKLSKKRPLRILDIGFGDAYIPRTLNASFVIQKKKVISHYVGLDIDDVSIKRTADTFPASIDHTLICDDITTGALERFKKNEFDVVIFLETIEHIKPTKVKQVLEEIKRIGQIAYISTPNITGGSGSIPEDHIKEWDYQELRGLILQTGIEIEKEIGIFCNLNKVKEIAKENKMVATIYNFLVEQTASDFLSIIMAKFIKTESQNIMYICKL